jgi:hypothetical protein
MCGGGRAHALRLPPRWPPDRDSELRAGPRRRPAAAAFSSGGGGGGGGGGDAATIVLTVPVRAGGMRAGGAGGAGVFRLGAGGLAGGEGPVWYWGEECEFEEVRGRE